MRARHAIEMACKPVAAQARHGAQSGGIVWKMVVGGFNGARALHGRGVA